MLLPRIQELGSLQDPIAPCPIAHLLLPQRTQPCCGALGAPPALTWEQRWAVTSRKTGRALQIQKVYKGPANPALAELHLLQFLVQERLPGRAFHHHPSADVSSQNVGFAEKNITFDEQNMI